jgi:hypothetical protein
MSPTDFDAADFDIGDFDTDGRLTRDARGVLAQPG